MSLGPDSAITPLLDVKGVTLQYKTRDHLVTAIKAHGHRHVLPLQGPEELPRVVREIARPGDYILCLGAGSITQWAYALPGQLAMGEGA